MIQSPFFWMSLSFSTGILLQEFYSRSMVWPLILCVGTGLLFVRGNKIFNGFYCAGLVLLGMTCADLDRFPAPSPLKLEIQRQGTDHFFAVTGKVITEPETKIYGRKQTVSFLFETSQTVRWEKSKRGMRKKVRGRLQVFLNQPGIQVHTGDVLRLWGRFELLPPLLNPGGFDYGSYLKARDVDFIFNAYGPKSVKLVRAANFKNPMRILSSVRQAIRDRSDSLFPEKESLLIRALILGDRKNLRGPILEDFLKTGTTHLLAISGLNISMVAGSFYLILVLLRVGQKKAAVCALILAALQTVIGGFGIPVQRAGVMASLGFLALILERERSSLNLFSLAFFLLLFSDTRNLLSVSFQLSFLSLFCLILFSRFWIQKWTWAEAWASGAAVMAGTFPVVLYHFSTFSPVGIAANVLAIPLFHFVLLTACLSLLAGSVPGLGFVLKGICGLFLKGGLAWIHFCASAEWGYFFLPRPSWNKIVFYYLLLIGLVCSALSTHPKKWILRGGFLTLWIATAVVFFIPKPAGNFRAVFFSAGSNELAHVEFGPGNHWLINSGRTFPGDQAQWILQPYLRSEGIKHLKGILFSDTRKRHTAGFETLQRTFRFQYHIYPALEKGSEPLLPAKPLFLRRGDAVHMPEGGHIRILGNLKGKFLFSIQVEGRTILFLPDLSVDTFQQLKESKNRQADILVLPALKDAENTVLKSILTLVSPHAVISPRYSRQALDLFSRREINFFDLTAQGALTVQTEQESGNQRMRMTPFLFPEKKIFI